jgi:plastocyanin
MAAAAVTSLVASGMTATAARSEPTTTDVAAAGNIFTGGLEFAPKAVSLHVGDIVRWTNTDFAVPHTATEDHGLWDLGGSYGGTPLTDAGFGPGAKVQRAFEAGTAHYFCRVHPTQMKAVVAVPVDLALRDRALKKGKRTRTVQDVVMTWASQPPADGQVFDVEMRRGTGAWTPVSSGTTQTSATIRAGVRGTVTAVRARLRSATTPSKGEDWSPDASVTSAQPASRAKKPVVN